MARDEHAGKHRKGQQHHGHSHGKMTTLSEGKFGTVVRAGLAALMSVAPVIKPSIYIEKANHKKAGVEAGATPSSKDKSAAIDAATDKRDSPSKKDKRVVVEGQPKIGSRFEQEQLVQQRGGNHAELGHNEENPHHDVAPTAASAAPLKGGLTGVEEGTLTGESGFKARSLMDAPGVGVGKDAAASFQLENLGKKSQGVGI
jgi:hypothetical protein